MEHSFDYNENMQYALEHIGEVLLNHTKLMEKFKKTMYIDAFMKYKDTCQPIFDAMQRACTVRGDETSIIIDSCIERALSDYDKSMEGMGKGKKTSYLENSKMVLALYTMPMILELKLEISEEYVDRFIEKWTEKYPKYVFRKGDYQSLVEGFQKKGFCYITTAVCEMQNKPDDCYELAMFREFRDGYLSNEDDGKALIEEYYELAPRILAAIELREEKQKIYEDIWKNHLSVCLDNLEKGQDELCKINYKRMVREMGKTYIS